MTQKPNSTQEGENFRIVIASDHAGFELKANLIIYLKAQGFSPLDLGTFSPAPVDYPDYAEKVAQSLFDKKAERAILICGSGVGATVAANKFPGVRACVCHDTYSAHQGVEHDNMNVLVLGSRVIGVQLAHELVDSFLKARFTEEERHVRRLMKIASFERKNRMEVA